MMKFSDRPAKLQFHIRCAVRAYRIGGLDYCTKLVNHLCQKHKWKLSVWVAFNGILHDQLKAQGLV